MLEMVLEMCVMIFVAKVAVCVFEERSDEISQQKKSKSSQNLAANAGKIKYVVYDAIRGIIRGLDRMLCLVKQSRGYWGKGEIEGLAPETRREQDSCELVVMIKTLIQTEADIRL